jgi:hypothetical protein
MPQPRGSAAITELKGSRWRVEYFRATETEAKKFKDRETYRVEREEQEV